MQGRVNILPHQVCHPITIKVMKRIKKALSEQPHDLAFLAFLGSIEFTKPAITGCNPEVHLLTNIVTMDNKICNQHTSFYNPSYNHYVLHHHYMDYHYHNAWVERHFIAMRCLSVAPRIVL